MVEAPDPKTFESWEDAFQYPVAAVRGMERQLRGDIESNRERLRSLVGASYRDLLGAAETIIQMDRTMQEVETHLGNIGAKCNTRMLEKKVSNLSRLDTTVGAGDAEKYAFASQLAVLKSCPEAISRLLKESPSVLLAAKVLVISRLLHTKLSQRSNSQRYLELLRNRLATLRRHILATIDRRMKTTDLRKDALIEAMCAFCLATSSSPTDALRHFHHVRLEAMSEQGQQSESNSERVRRAMRLYTSTLRDTKAAFPNMLNQALERLQSIPLFKSTDLYALVELNLDLHLKRIEDDILSFTPYIRLNDLGRPESERLLRQWARRGLSSLLDVLRRTLDGLTDTIVVMDLRRDLFELWFCVQHDCTGIEPSELVEGLRDAFNACWTKMIEKQVLSLKEVGSMAADVVHGWPDVPSDSDKSLWSSAVVSMDISFGSRAFRQALLTKAHGGSDALRFILDRYTDWLEALEKISTTISKVKATKWEDSLIDGGDDDGLLDDKQILLAEDDPRLLQEQCSKSVHEAFSTLRDKLTAVAEELVELSDGRKAVFLLRLWRDVRQKLPKDYPISNLGGESVALLHTVMARSVLREPLKRGKKRVAKSFRENKVPSRPLWEGDPPTPVLPSPWAFRLLREVTSSMAEYGSDVWSTSATDQLKRELRQFITASIQDSGGRLINVHDSESGGESHTQGTMIESNDGLGEQSGSPIDASPTSYTFTNGDIQKRHSEAFSFDICFQQIFDLLYLAQATACKRSKSNENKDVLLLLLSELEAEVAAPTESMTRIRKGADDYWKRTSQLFALLT